MAMVPNGHDFRQVARGLGEVRRLEAGDWLFAEGDLPRHMYVLLEGRVEISSRGRVIETVEPGDGIGIVSLIDGRPRATTAVATVASEVAVIDGKRFRFMVEETPNFVWFVMDELVQRLRAINAQL